MKRSLPLAATLKAALAFVPKAWAYAPGALILLFSAFALHCWGAKLGLGAWRAPLSCLLILLTGLMAGGALYRLGVTSDLKAARALGLGPLGLQFGAAELRLVASGVLVGLFLGLVCLALGVVLVFVFNGLGAGEWSAALSLLVSPVGWRAKVAVFAVALSLWTLVQLTVRLILYKAATVARRRIVTVSALGLSAGVFWRLLLGLVVVSSPTLAVVIWRCQAPPVKGSGLAELVEFVFLQAPLSVGFLSEAYKRLEYWRNSGEG